MTPQQVSPFQNLDIAMSELATLKECEKEFNGRDIDDDLLYELSVNNGENINVT